MQTKKWKHIFHIKLGTCPWEGSPSCTIPCPYFWLYNSPLSFFCVLGEPSSLHMLLYLWCHEPSSVSKGCLFSFLLLPQILNPPLSSPVPSHHALPPWWVTQVQSIIASARLPLWQPVRVDSPSPPLLTGLLSWRVLPGWTSPALTHITCSSPSSISCLGPTFVVYFFFPVGLAGLPIHHPLFLSPLITPHMSQTLKSVHLSPFASPLLSSTPSSHFLSRQEPLCILLRILSLLRSSSFSLDFVHFPLT